MSKTEKSNNPLDNYHLTNLDQTIKRLLAIYRDLKPYVFSDPKRKPHKRFTNKDNLFDTPYPANAELVDIAVRNTFNLPLNFVHQITNEQFTVTIYTLVFNKTIGIKSRQLNLTRHQEEAIAFGDLAVEHDGQYIKYTYRCIIADYISLGDILKLYYYGNRETIANHVFDENPAVNRDMKILIDRSPTISAELNPNTNNIFGRCHQWSRSHGLELYQKWLKNRAKLPREQFYSLLLEYYDTLSLNLVDSYLKTNSLQDIKNGFNRLKTFFGDSLITDQLLAYYIYRDIPTKNKTTQLEEFNQPLSISDALLELFERGYGERYKYYYHKCSKPLNQHEQMLVEQQPFAPVHLDYKAFQHKRLDEAMPIYLLRYHLVSNCYAHQLLNFVDNVVDNNGMFKKFKHQITKLERNTTHNDLENWINKAWGRGGHHPKEGESGRQRVRNRDRFSKQIQMEDD